ncbi:LysR family transcriptional regulator ArgP [Atopomonas sediminilitoris]|uniref:LysR family transcriptional regulator ArgP n=1 Tax=Atopomonas sediminilitoris TaxID=2919919 RepID=UPI001F4DD91E|nr:LysR family transcriptional regulator ArgP [Atopomonas sediminilitoris]MCJ8168706.1 LysR family transcriptional regulator ArgP [Atopomonas sediminilitoris]
MIDYKLLEALVAVVTQAGFERAALQLHISQSAVSQRIRLLEARVGQAVLVRSLPPQPTPLGRQLLNHMQQVQVLQQQLAAQVPLLGEAGPARLRVAINADSLATWWPLALAQVWENHAVLFEHVLVDQAVGLERMRAGEVAACICAHDKPVAGARSEYLGSMLYRAVCSPRFAQHYLPQRYQQQRLLADELVAAPAIVFGPDDRLQHRFLAEQGIEGSFQHHVCPSSEGFVGLAKAGLGYGLIPLLQIEQALAAGELLDVSPGWQLAVPLYWHHWRQDSPLISALGVALRATAARCLSA